MFTNVKQMQKELNEGLTTTISTQLARCSLLHINGMTDSSMHRPTTDNHQNMTYQQVRPTRHCVAVEMHLAMSVNCCCELAASVVGNN